MVCLRNGWKGMAKAYGVGLGEWGGVWIKREEPVPGGLFLDITIYFLTLLMVFLLCRKFNIKVAEDNQLFKNCF